MKFSLHISSGRSLSRIVKILLAVITLFGFLAAPPVHSQPSNDSASESMVFIKASTTRTVVTFYIIGTNIDTSAQRWRPILERVVGTPLTAIKGRKAGYESLSNILRFRGEPIGTRYNLQRRGQIDLKPLIAELKTDHTPWLNYSLQFERMPVAQVSGLTATPTGDGNGYVYFDGELKVDSDPVPALNYRLGYEDFASYATAFTLLALLIFPLLATFIMRRIALRRAAAAKVEPDIIWFGYWRFLSWLSTGAWILWFGALISLKAHSYVSFLLGGNVMTRRLGVDQLWPLAMGFVIVGCNVLSYPVFALVRGSELSRGDLARQAAWGQARMLPVFCFATGAINMMYEPRVGVLWFAIAFIAMVAANRGVMRSMALEPQALLVGELRDRVFALAAAAGVKLQQVYYLPTGKGRMANAFAATGNQVFFTDHLLQHLNKREVDAVIAHELTHLKRRHPSALAFMSIALIVLVVAVITLAEYRDLNPYQAGACYVLVFSIGLFAIYYMSRRFEHAADAGAVNLTGDAEACITSLGMLSRLNRMPLDWGNSAGRWLTHPSTLRRIQAMGKRGGLPPERMQELVAALASQGTGEAESTGLHYTVPAAATERSSFSTSFKANQMMRLSWALLIGSACLPAAVALFAQWQALRGPVLFALYAGGFSVTFLARHALLDFMNQRAFRKLEKQARAALPNIDLAKEERQWEYVGFAPGANPRLYELWPVWDAGLISVTGDELLYIGDHTRFRLTPAQITKVETRRDQPSWFPCTSLYIYWRSTAVSEADETESAGCFALLPSPVLGRRAGHRQMQALYQKLSAWQATAMRETSIDSATVTWQAPHIGEVTSHNPRGVASLKVLLQGIYNAVLVAAGACVLFGLSLSSPTRSVLYTLAVPALFVLISLIPFWRYRDRVG